jgi:hypothetical protein
MRSYTFKVNTVLFILVILTLGLVSLGMRLPNLNGFSSSSKPKPRPRAILKTQIKACKESIKSQDNTKTIFSNWIAHSCPMDNYLSAPFSAGSDTSYKFISIRLSRAPPFHS